MKKHFVSYRVGRFPQLSRRVFTSEQGLCSDNITAVGFDEGGKLFVGTDCGLCSLDGDSFVPFDLGTESPNVCSLSFSGGFMFVGVGSELLTYRGGERVSSEGFSSQIVDVKLDSEGASWILTRTVLYKRAADTAFWEIAIGVPGCGSCLELYRDGRVYVGTSDNGLYSLVGKRWHWCELREDTTGIISDKVSCLHVDPAGNVWGGTDKGVFIYDDNSFWRDSSNTAALPDANITGIAVDKDGVKYFSTTTGMIRLENGKLSYFGYKRWLPSPRASGIAVSPDGSVCVATDAGLSVIEARMMTLEEKAFELRALTEKFNIRKDGYALIRKLDHEGVVSLDEGYIPTTDNDGLRTGIYTAALCYEYACTKNEEVRSAARRSLNAMIKLTDITGVNGFSARAIRYADERDYGTGARHEWHITADSEGRELEWLGETSSDEMVGHFYCYANYYDLVADEEEKEMLRGVVSRILDHILSHDFRLVDTDGKPTTWANWNPNLLNDDQKWVFEKGTNSLQILTFLKIGYHMTGNEKYEETFRYLTDDRHYAMNLMQYRIPDGHLCHIDDNHDFLMISLLMRYVDDPELRSVFAMGLSHHWADEKAERNAFYNFVYGACTGDAFDADSAIEELADYPLDQISWTLYNSYRSDLDWNMAPAELGMVPQLHTPLSAHERRITDNDLNRFVVDSGAEDIAPDPFSSDEPTAYNVLPGTGNDKGMEFYYCTNYTHPYWFARYFGLIEEL